MTQIYLGFLTKIDSILLSFFILHKNDILPKSFAGLCGVVRWKNARYVGDVRFCTSKIEVLLLGFVQRYSQPPKGGLLPVLTFVWNV
jgi:hypothetical protein